MGPHADRAQLVMAFSSTEGAERRPVPVPSLNAVPPLAVRVFIALCGIALLVTALPALTPTAEANLGNAISSSRQSQRYYERSMLQQDRALRRIQTQVRQTRRAYQQSKRAIKRWQRVHRGASKAVIARRARLRDVENAFETPTEAPKPWRYKKRLKEARQRVRQAEARKRLVGKRLRASVRARQARLARIRSLKRQRGAAISRREAAEGALGAHIVRMTGLAASRARTQTAVQLTAGGDAFSWPSSGRISQTYGCTGFRLNPRRGSCRHFHDGLDIVSGYGSPVRAAAVGVVAYVGWNPWDEGGRAFIVVLAHPNGFVTRYGHLVSRKPVRAGQLVHTGQPIGRMGNTGKSTGTHLHFELLKNGQDVNPLGYLPSSGPKINVDRKSTKKGIAKAKRKARQKARAVARKQARKERKQERKAARKAARQAATAAVAVEDCDEAGALAVASSTAAATATAFTFTLGGAADLVVGVHTAAGPPCEPDEAPAEPVEVAAETVPTEEPVRSQSKDRPGVRTPFRGTSPIPE
jgi:murein DD-endopeptidase MepM/ murein hydrolase activator NlpD